MKILSPGEAIGDRFVVESLLGEGGIARVYRVRHKSLGSVHALKLLSISRAALEDRLIQEGRIQAQLVHPNLVRVTDILEHAGYPGLVMEYVAGTNLQNYLALRGALPANEGLELMSQVIAGVAVAHEAGVLHRDLKPANILLGNGPSGLVPKVSDFGIAKVAQEGLREGVTRSGLQMGTPGYMAPEQIEDSAQVDRRADVFAIGAIVYELLSGERAFSADSSFSTLRATIEGRLKPLEESMEGCPPHIAAAVNRALAVEPGDRFDDCFALADALLARHPDLRARIVRRAAPLKAAFHTPADRTPSARPGGSRPTFIPDGPASDGGADAPAPRPHRTGASTGTALGGSVDVMGSNRPPPALLGGIGAASDEVLSSRALPSINPAESDAGAGSLDVGVSIGGVGPDSYTPDEDAPAVRRNRRVAGVGLPLLALGGMAGGLLVVGALVVGLGLWSGGIDTEVLDPVAVAGEPDAEPVPELAGEQPPPEDAPAASTPATPAAATPAAATAAAPAAKTPPPATTPAAASAAPKEAAEAPAPAAPATTEATDAASTPPAEKTAAQTGASGASAAKAPTAAVVDAEVEPEDDDEPTVVRIPRATPPADPAAADTTAADTTAADTTAGDGVAAVQEDDTEAVEAPAAEPTFPPMVGTWVGEAGGRPLTLIIAQQDAGVVSGEVRIKLGGTDRVARVTGKVASSGKLTLSESGGSQLYFEGLVRGTGVMGTYTRQGAASGTSWSARRQ